MRDRSEIISYEETEDRGREAEDSNSISLLIKLLQDDFFNLTQVHIGNSDFIINVFK